ncbi:DUF58 domain-containing protein [Pseudomonas guariconensis]|uniref:DUF58 domain-containing protein n=1 Tax=Pseudomonas TaxID=286 RepID=UPI001CE4106D|nr:MULTISPECIES: DUF58 domain-containing protein [Pseudomonas]MCO7639370.1 DUF58 domain-containing protein [Pseudomonas sp. S 311-6]MCO7515164.1 DUF58 domain-containing protein [Pseudomonas putida]MCO7565074.1 DUF58 domain-containing protein [Pseudomonas mosselii]MCO7593819.1 DUF58 domain-containing protein [Pseudomonas guariconensis]MCO7605041.1 DUF58 domain-containing protein [Pseudomonas guariconensis]
MPVVADGAVYASLEQLMLLEHRVRGLSFLSRQPLSSVLSGNHAARLRGRGLSFDELRQYTPGDDLRHLDWRASLRYSKPFVRSYTEERDRPTLVLVDQRMSMYFGSQRVFKSVTAAELGAIGAWMALHAGDRVGGLVFGDKDIESIRPLRSRARVEALCAAIVRHNHRLHAMQADDEQAGQLDRVLRHCLGIAGHDHLIVIISDFAGVTEQTLQLLRQLAAHNDVLALQVFDPIALQVPDRGRLTVTQGQVQVELEIERRQVNRPLGDFLAGRLKDVATLLRRSQVPLMMFSTGRDSLEQLRAELGRLTAVAR